MPPIETQLMDRMDRLASCNEARSEPCGTASRVVVHVSHFVGAIIALRVLFPHLDRFFLAFASLNRLLRVVVTPARFYLQSHGHPTPRAIIPSSSRPGPVAIASRAAVPTFLLRFSSIFFAPRFPLQWTTTSDLLMLSQGAARVHTSAYTGIHIHLHWHTGNSLAHSTAATYQHFYRRSCTFG